MLRRLFGYNAKHCSKSLLKIDFIPFLSRYAHSSSATCSDTCSLGYNGSTKFWHQNVVLDSFLEGRSNGSRMLCRVEGGGGPLG
jgi:hypothetical protein